MHNIILTKTDFDFPMLHILAAIKASYFRKFLKSICLIRQPMRAHFAKPKTPIFDFMFISHWDSHSYHLILTNRLLI